MIKTFFTPAQKKQITNAIAQAELKTSGEIRVHIEHECKGEVLDRAAFIFKKLEMHKTKLRNGVLFYLSVDDRQLAILGDAGINEKVPPGFWNNIIAYLISEFKRDNYAAGLSEAIAMAGNQLKEHFPYTDGDINELSNEISYGEKENDEEDDE